ncbi:hypothetical protein GQ53DRAFT_828413 [Thozetella sp. PMI_491]|nr:hypothetical protein GQ53DRAFT_828413 [Thozetella sp. PMI_491]
MSLGESLPDIPESRYDRVCQHVYRKIYRKLERKDDRERRFITQASLSKCLTDQTLREFFDSLGTATWDAEAIFQIQSQVFTVNIKERGLQNFLACLIFAGCPVSAARSFTIKLVAGEPLRDGDAAPVGLLPATRGQLDLIFGDLVARDKFMGSQSCFVPAVVLRRREEVTVPNLHAGRLPYLSEEPIAEGSGSSGKVSKVRIAKGQFIDPREGDTIMNVHEVARKDYYREPYSNHQHEHKIMLQILKSDSECENVLETFGTIHIASENMYCLFMPLALCDLRTYLRESHHYRPITTKARAKVIKSAEGLASGLDFLHRKLKVGTSNQKLVLYHMDLKPANILVFPVFTRSTDGQTPEGDEVRYVWKISDFGMSKIKEAKRKSDSAGDDNDDSSGDNDSGSDNDDNRPRSTIFRNWLKIQPGPKKGLSLATPTKFGRPPGTYLAPECIEERDMSSKSDVWSLGCIISVLFAYLDGGRDGVIQYQDARIFNGKDWFFFYDRRARKSRGNPNVKKSHTWLIERAEERGPAEHNATKHMLRYLENQVLRVDKNSRDIAKRVKKALSETWEILQDISGASNDSSQQDRRRPSFALEQLSPWNQLRLNDVKGCEASPMGTYVAYWSDRKITVFNSVSLAENGIFNRMIRHDVPLDDNDNCIFNSLALTESNLVVSTTGLAFQCYIYNIRTLPNGFCTVSSWHLILELPSLGEIHKLKLSPNGETLACIVRDRKDPKGAGSLFYAEMSDLKGFAQDKNKKIHPMWKLIKLKGPACDVTRLEFAGNHQLCLVLQPELTAETVEHQVLIVSVRLSTGSLQILSFKPHDLDLSNPAALFSTFVPLRHGNACAVVIRQNRVLIQTFPQSTQSPADESDSDVQLCTGQYRITNMVSDRGSSEWDTGRWFALGTKSGSNEILLLSLSVDGETQQLKISEAQKLDGLQPRDDFVLHLYNPGSGSSDERCILIMCSLTPFIMEFVGLALGVGGVTAKVSSKLWELTKRWQDAPREIFALRDSVMRAENFFVEVATVIEASTTDTVTEPRTQYEQISVLLRHGEATLREVDTIIDQVQEVVPSISEMVTKGLRTPGGDVKLKKFTWLKKRARVTAIQKQLKDIMLHICGLLLSLNTSMSADIHSSVGHLHETQLARGGDPFSPFHESLTNRIEQTLTTHIDQRLEQIVMDIVKRVAPVPAHTPISPWTPFIHGTTKCVQTSFRCDSDCGCRCHSPRGYGSWTLSALKSVAGTVNLSFTGFNLRGSACDRQYCKSGRSGHQRVCLSYILPPWLLNKVIFLIYNDITGSPEMLLRIVRVVSPEYLSVSDSIFGSVRSESVEGLKVALKNKKGSIYDILSGFLYTPLGFAIAYGYIDSARILLRAGSDPFQQHGIVEAPIRAAFRIFLNGTEPYATDYAELFDFGDLLEEDYSELQRVILGLMPGNLDQLLSTPRTASTLNHVNYSG